MLPLLTMDRLREKSRRADEPLFTWISEDGGESAHLTAAPLLETAGAIAGFLRQECRIEPGERAILAYPLASVYEIAR